MSKELMDLPAGFHEKITQEQADEYNKKTNWPVGGYEWLEKESDEKEKKIKKAPNSC